MSRKTPLHIADSCLFFLSSLPLLFFFIRGDHAHLKQSLTTRDTHVPSGRGQLHMSPKGKGDTQLASGRGKLHMGPKGKGDTQLASGMGQVTHESKRKGDRQTVEGEEVRVASIALKLAASTQSQARTWVRERSVKEPRLSCLTLG